MPEPTPTRPSHPFDADPKASLPGVYCKCGYDVDLHEDKGNATVRDGRYVMPEPSRKGSQQALNNLFLAAALEDEKGD